jgi:ubiquinone/menaquinone biosynthesis C-methylase UbiE
MKAIESWLSEADLGSIYSAGYWNDIESEKKKPWWIEDGDYARCHDYLRDSKLMLEYQQSEGWIREMNRSALRVLDLAAGIGWTAALLSKLDCVDEVHAVEISVHRLERLFPHAVTMFEARADKIQRYLGSFYELKMPSASVDVVYLSQAFHHAERPLQLLVECDRVLKPGGRILLIGEPAVSAMQAARRFAGYTLRNRRLTFDFHRLFPTDRETGDHYYRRAEYFFMFQSLGYSVRQQKLGSGEYAYVADKP